MNLSIVSGTYNRKPYLERMVGSVRKSIGDFDGLTYEIVLVDGGSTDGTLEWCKEQPDIRLIEHGKLLGAVKAFNDGARAARGDYVILANDDIEFLEDTLLQGWIYMQQHPNCGVGCFYQDRNRREWHVEQMPVVIDGKQSYAPYGQVCIVPRWLGNHVGWWGDYLHTYGGDNELSSRVYELGYKVSPVPGTKIHDTEAADELRKKNNISGGKDPRAVNGHHPDSWDWGKKWRNEALNLVGAVVSNTPALPNTIPLAQRTVYLPIYEPGWPVQREQKRGLREALSRVGLVAEFDYVGRNQAVGKGTMLTELLGLLQKIKPTLVLTQFHNPDPLGPPEIVMMRNAAPGATFVNWNGDFWPDNLLSEDGLRLAQAFDWQTTVNREADETYRAKGIRSAYWQIGWEPDGIGHAPEVFHEVVFLANGYSPARQEFVGKLRGLDVDFALYGQGWPPGWSLGQNLYNFREACKVYRGAKIALGDSQWPESGFVSNRVMQALAAGGCALAHQWFRGMEQLGLVDGETCIIWRDFGELVNKIEYYLKHETKRQRIAEAGEQLALERHSFDARVTELLDLIGVGSPVLAGGWRW